jgi:hypothetical protein
MDYAQVNTIVAKRKVDSVIAGFQRSHVRKHFCPFIFLHQRVRNPKNQRNYRTLAIMKYKALQKRLDEVRDEYVTELWFEPEGPAMARGKERFEKAAQEEVVLFSLDTVNGGILS